MIFFFFTRTYQKTELLLRTIKSLEMFWLRNCLKIHFLICFQFFVSIKSNKSTNAHMAMQYEIIEPRLEFKVIPSGKNSRAHTEWKYKMFFNVYLTTNTPVTIDVSSQMNLFLQYIWGHDMKPLTLLFSLFFCSSSSVSLPHSLSLSLSLSLLKHLSSVFSLQALCALWCCLLQLFTHQSCHLCFIDASS